MKQNTWAAAFRAAFPHTLPIFAGFTFLGLTYGILMNVSGFSFWYPMLISITVFAGSMQFVSVGLLLSAFDPLQTFAMTLMINARHLFYGVTMLDKYRATGRKRFYLIFGMCDETFSINCAVDAPAGIDRGRFMLCVTLLNHIYWVTGSTLGGIFGSLIQFNTEGLDFAMTALFVVIFVEQWLKESDHTVALLGVALPVISLLIFGADNFMLPAMLAILAALLCFRKVFEKGGRPV